MAGEEGGSVYQLELYLPDSILTGLFKL